MTIAKKILFLFLSFGTVIAGAQEKRFQITGTVTDSVTKEPLVGVYVTTGKLGAQTDYNGKYTIKNVPAQAITLSTMYYSAYPVQNKIFLLKNDTTVNFLLTQEISNLGEVVVTGTRTEKRLSETPVLTTVVRDREIQKAGAISTLEALEDNIPGIVTSPNAMGNNLRIKGLNSRYILFLVDGERMVSEGAGGNVNLNQIDVNNRLTQDKIMKINEIIEERMHYRGVNQTMVCRECGLIVQNFNAFLKGSRGLAIESLIKVMKHLNLAFSKGGSVFSPNLIEDKVKISLKGSEVKMVTIAKSIKVSGSTLSTIVNGKRKMSSKVLYALIDYFGIEVVTIK